MRALLALSALCFGLPTFGQGLWTVSQADVSADFSNIQAAIDAAANGDSIHIGPGVYEGFNIDGKGLVLTSEAGETFTIEGAFLLTSPIPTWVRVGNLPSGSFVTIRGMRINTPFMFPTPGVTGIDLRNNLGELWLEDVVVDGSNTPLSNSVHGLNVVNNAAVTLVDSKFTAGPFSPAMESHNSNMFVFGSELFGGVGGEKNGTSGTYLDGGPGVRIVGGNLFASDSLLQGGAGADSVPLTCEPVTDGGAGVHFDGGSFNSRSGNAMGGAAGFGAPCGLPNGTAGANIAMISGTHNAVLEPDRGVHTKSPVSLGDLATQDYYGSPGELIFTTLGFSLNAGTYLPEFAGPTLLGTPQFYRLCGLLNGSGERSKSFTVGDLGIGAVTVYFQPAFLDLGTLDWRLGNPSALTLLN